MRRDDGMERPLHDGDELPLLRRASRALSRQECAADLRLVGRRLRRELDVQGRRRRSRTAIERLRLLEAAVRFVCTAAQRGTARPALETARAGRRAALFQRLRAGRSAQGANGKRSVPPARSSGSDGPSQAVRGQRRLCRRRATSGFRSCRRRRHVNLWFYERDKVSGIFNVGTGSSATFNDVAKAIIAWHGRGAIRYIPFPDELRSRYQNFTEADVTALRTAGYSRPFRDVRAGIKDYLDALVARP
jgi:hypothetical protein